MISTTSLQHVYRLYERKTFHINSDGSNIKTVTMIDDDDDDDDD